ncbi:MAG TPA: hypothetical protein VIW03_08360 [Anaeromyxobacter sp.]
MGDETTQFASRFSDAVRFLAALADGGAGAELTRRHGADLPAAVRRALESVEAVYATETGAVRDWAEQRRRVLAQIARLREALEASGVGDEARRHARALVRLVDPGAEAAGVQRRRGR